MTMRRAREQSGYIYKRSGWWVLRYRESVLEGGRLVRRQLAKQIEQVSPEHMRLKRPPAEIENKAKAMLQPLNNRAYTPEATQTLGQFVDSVYFPNLESQKRASTVKGYRARWASQLKPRCASYRLRDFRTSDAQRLLSDVARENPELCRSTLHHLRSLLSAIFKHAIQQGPLDGPNPIREVGIPNAPQGEETYAYTLEEELRLLLYLPQPAYTITALAAFTGLRRSELAGQLWENYDGQELQVTQSVWEGYINEPKTKSSKASVPVIPVLARILNAYREQCGSPKSGPMFKSEADTPLNLNNALNRIILPALNKCAVCGKERLDHAGANHEYNRDASRPEWHGWHAFRRGLGTNLAEMGVDDLTIQRILRHANVATTRQHYIKVRNPKVEAAMQLLEVALCANRAPSATPVEPTVIN